MQPLDGTPHGEPNASHAVEADCCSRGAGACRDRCCCGWLACGEAGRRHLGRNPLHESGRSESLAWQPWRSLQRLGATTPAWPSSLDSSRSHNVGRRGRTPPPPKPSGSSRRIGGAYSRVIGNRDSDRLAHRRDAAHPRRRREADCYLGAFARAHTRTRGLSTYRRRPDSCCRAGRAGPRSLAVKNVSSSSDLLDPGFDRPSCGPF